MPAVTPIFQGVQDFFARKYYSQSLVFEIAGKIESFQWHVVQRSGKDNWVVKQRSALKGGYMNTSEPMPIKVAIEHARALVNEKREELRREGYQVRTRPHIDLRLRLSEIQKRLKNSRCSTEVTPHDPEDFLPPHS